MEHCDNNTNQNANGQSPDSISQCSRPGLAVLFKGGNMYEIAEFINCKAKYSTAIQQVNFPIYKGKPNPVHGKFYFVGSIPAECYDEEKGKSKKYDTEQDAIDAAVTAGADRIQRCDCSFVEL